MIGDSKERPHQRLDVWRDAMELVALVYAFSARLPAEERYGLSSQMRRAAISVPSNIAEGAARRSLAELIRFLVPRMAHFMVPRYVRIVAELPRTPTQKVQKHLLRSEGVTADTFDREKAGIHLKRERIGTTASG